MAFITPQIQEYHDPANGNPTECYAIRPDINQIIGRFSVLKTYTRFYFPDGTVLNSAKDSDLLLTFNTAVAGTLIYNYPYGNVLWGTKDGIQNYTGLASFNPYTTPWTVISEWGTAGSGPTPDNVSDPVSMAVTEIDGNLNLVIGGNVAGKVSLLEVSSDGSFAETPTEVYQAGGNGTTYVTNGPLGTVYWILYPIVIANTDVIFGKVDNTGFVNIRSYHWTAFNTLATSYSQFTSLAYDATDGNVLAMVTTNNSDASTTQYLCKFDVSNGDILWKTSIEIGPGNADAAVLSQSVIQNQTFYWFGYYENSDPPGSSTNLYVIDTSTGVATIHFDTTLGTALSCQNQISNDRIKGIICNGTWNSGAGTIQLLNSTSNSRTDCLAAVYFVDNKTVPDHISFCPPNLDTE